MTNKDREKLFLGKLFTFENEEYFCKDVSENSTHVTLSTDKRLFYIPISEFTSFFYKVSFAPKKLDTVLKNKPVVKKPTITATKLKIGKFVKTKRKELGYSMDQLGSISGLGKAGKITILKIEKGENNTTIDTLDSILKALDSSFEEVFEIN
jgi:DNA-binding XRE family transcriptional regulator